ncbi:hypothetical protein [Pontibacillus yanchengensis]|uniref:Ribbon-helix-helix protein CopG domain-containing protein n=1 Tax=Pontibacillus yanchengensis Y32 TaxID=1385514 RepID=A0A0A2T5I0_9BACI|nr:hypothetical protein [Pontibacillus yanchengensis]KGP71057.1 hypothetical protein N782_01710 [Pontibacillus yanchengensis Y32]
MGKINLNVRIDEEIKNELDLVADHMHIKRAELVRLAIMQFRESGHVSHGLSYQQALQDVHQECQDIESKLHEIQESRRSSKGGEMNVENANQTIIELKKHVQKLEKDLKGGNHGETEREEPSGSSIEENL